MPAFVSWVDSSSADRERMRRAIELFQERDTRDELGLGTIRDAFADAFFPGTSTIETRLRYCLYIPWIYRELEASRVSVDDLPRQLRKRETALIRPLLASDDPKGTIGGRAKENVQRLPSSVYWATLRRWRICWFPGSQEQFHRSFDRLRQRRQTELLPDDEGARTAVATSWHPRLPDPPPGWPDEVSHTLRREEAEFLRGRIQTTCPDTVLAELATLNAASDVGYPWLHPNLADLPLHLQTDLDLARRFSLVVQGVALLYNLLLAEKAGRDDWIEAHRAAIDAWAHGDEAADLHGFDLHALWTFVERQHANVPGPTRRFVHDWVRLLDELDPARVRDSDDACALVRRREGALKTTRSRFTNARALDQWGGSSGAARLEFRWAVTQRFLADLHDARDDED